jgi:fructose-bisphosphate aldolase, class II
MRPLPEGGADMSALKEVLQEAEKNRVAIGHFNFSELVVLKAATEATSELGVPVVMGLSESEREFLGVQQAAALVHSMREEKDGEIFLNADHTHSIERAEKGSASEI